MYGFVLDAGQLCASCTNTERRDTCHHYVECAEEEVKLLPCNYQLSKA